ncbi:dipeptidase [Oceanotoga sp. DSM 15011]|uniref:dipeptidase n=1 Tax=Oceanotoga sp. DSM 15011 TaxID=2984951 RepID=UPI0021F4C984|nr:dipeptidase [Oceanotoga sp. DSM 15011]UYO99002.1 dipeptidase [Oceanotoga sp. DSM 15011]
MNDKIKKIHDETIVVDAHYDLLMDLTLQKNFNKFNVIKNDHLNNFKKGGLSLIVSSIFIDKPIYKEAYLHETLDQIALFMEEIEKNEEITFCKSYEDILNSKKQNKIGIMLSFEGADPLFDDLHLLKIFYELGVRFIGLTWSRRNYISDGCKFGPVEKDKRSYGITDFGVNFIKKAENLGYIIDISHLSETGFYDFIKINQKPFIVSHTNVRHFTNNTRTLSDEQIKIIKENDGIIGINSYKEFFNEKSKNISAYVDQIEYIINKIGDKNVGIGLDICTHLLKYEPFNEEKISPNIIKDHSEFTKITEEMLKRNYNESTIKNVLGENFINFYKNNL